MVSAKGEPLTFSILASVTVPAAPVVFLVVRLTVTVPAVV